MTAHLSVSTSDRSPHPAEDAELDALLGRATEEAARLLAADGAFLYLLDPATGRLRFTHEAGIEDLPPDHWFRGLELRVGTGMFGQAVADRRVVVTGDYPADPRFVHVSGPDRIVAELAIRSMVVAPLVAGDDVFGALGTFSKAADAFTAPQIALVRALADHAALAMANARLIAALARSREAVARQALIERSLRELGTRISAAREPGTVVQHTVDEALALLHGDGARIDIVDAEANLLRGMYSSGAEEISEAEWPRDPNDRLEVGVSGAAVTRGRTQVTGDYLADTSLVHGAGPDTYVRNKGIRSVIATPLLGDAGPFGAITVWATRRDAFTDDDGALLETIAGQAAVALGRARLIEELAASQEALRRRAEEERSLREIARRLMTIQDPAALLQDVVAEAARLLGRSGAAIDLLDPASGEARWTYDAGVDEAVREELIARQAGMDGVVAAIRQRRVVVSDDYPADEHYPDGLRNAAFLTSAGVRSIAFAPLVGEATVLGTLSVFAPEVGRFDAQDAATLAALADLATIAIHNAELIGELARSREETAQRAETERTLREIAARVTSIRDPETILALIVEEARRVLRSDGAHLTRLSDDGTFLRPVVVAGGMDEATRAWLRSQEFPLEGGINGLAAAQGRPVWTPSYTTDPRIPRDPDDLSVADRMGLGAMAAAPLRAPGGDVIGTLAVSYRAPGPISGDQLATLQALADHAAIAVSNSDLLARLEASEARFRRLVQTSPDTIWRTDAEGRLTFVGDAAEPLVGWSPDELAARHFTTLVDPESLPLASDAWRRLADPSEEARRYRFLMRRRDGTRFPAEVAAVGIFEDGRFVGVQGTVRDIGDRERLEEELRESEARYRSVIQSSPDLIWATDGHGRYSFVSDRVRDLLGWEVSDVLGRPFREFVDVRSVEAANEEWARLAREPGRTQTQRLDIRHRDGTLRAFEVSSMAVVRDGQVENVYGVARDVTERERLERELRRQAAELASSEERAHLARELHDSVTQALFSMTLLSRSAELLLERDPSQVPAKLAALRELQRDALAEMRALIFELRPGNIEETGLVGALRTHTAALSGRVGLPVVVEADLPERPPLEIEETLYRIAQEGLHNVVKHAGARGVRVEIGRVADGVRLRVVDDGRGFDPALVPDGHLGLAGMRSRAERLAGRMTVTSAPGTGTTIDVLVPDPAAEAARAPTERG